MLKVLISGANGYIGAKIAGRLRADGSSKVIGIDKNAPAVHPMRDGKTCRILPADITDPDSLPDEIAAANVLIHCAALVHKHAADLSRTNYFTVNHQGTINLLAALDPKRVKRLIFLSTVSVYGSTAHAVVPDEETNPAPEDFYGESKLAAEKEILAYGRAHHIPFTTFRLTPVYGRDSLVNINKRIYLPRQVAFYRINRGTQCMSLCSVNNVADVVAESIENRDFFDECYILRDASDYSFDYIIRTFKDLFLQKHKPVIDIPAALPRAVFKSVARIWPARGRYYLYSFDKVARDQVYSGEKLNARGIRMRWNLEKTLREGE